MKPSSRPRVSSSATAALRASRSTGRSRSLRGGRTRRPSTRPCGGRRRRLGSALRLRAAAFAAAGFVAPWRRLRGAALARAAALRRPARPWRPPPSAAVAFGGRPAFAAAAFTAVGAAPSWRLRPSPARPLGPLSCRGRRCHVSSSSRRPVPARSSLFELPPLRAAGGPFVPGHRHRRCRRRRRRRAMSACRSASCSSMRATAGEPGRPAAPLGPVDASGRAPRARTEASRLRARSAVAASSPATNCSRSGDGSPR